MFISLLSCSSNKSDDPISNMTTLEKVTQILMPSLRYETFGDEIIGIERLNDSTKTFLKKYQFSGFILFSENLVSSTQAQELINDIQSTNPSIPYLISVDQEGGYVKRIEFGTGMPGNMALCASNNPKNAYEATNIMGNELNALGINLNFAPVIDINSNPNNPVIGVRAFSDDPEYSKDFIKESIKGFHDSNVAVSIKHFPGHGDTAVDSHTGLPLIEKSLEEIKDFEIKTFEMGIEDGADMIMTAHIQFPNIDNTTYVSTEGNEIYLPATLSNKIIGILREDLNYDGVICSDSLVMEAIKNNFKKEVVVKLALEAGVDILLIPVDTDQNIDDYLSELEEYINMIVEMVESKELDEKLLDRAVERILKLKKERGLFDKDDNKEKDVKTFIGSKESHDKELAITSECITLVENNNALPLSNYEKTLVLLPYSSQINSVLFAKQILLEEKSIEVNLDYIEYGDSSFDINILDDYDAVVIVSNTYGLEELNNDNSKIIDSVIFKAKESNKKNILISAQLPYDLARYEADTKIAIYYGSGVTEIPQDYTEDIKTYAPNLVASIVKLYEQASYNGLLPVDIPVLELDGDIYRATSDIKYPRGFGIKE